MDKGTKYVLAGFIFIMLMTKPVIDIIFDRPHVTVDINSANLVDSTAIIDVVYWDNRDIIDSDWDVRINIADLDSLKREYNLKLDVTVERIKSEKKLIKSLSK